MHDIVKIVIYMRNVKQFEQMNKIYKKYFVKGEEPARFAVQAQSPLPGIDIEIEAMAVIKD